MSKKSETTSVYESKSITKPEPGQTSFTMWRKSVSGLIQSPCLGRVWAFGPAGAKLAYARECGVKPELLDCVAVAN